MFKAAIAAVHMSLISLAALPAFTAPAAPPPVRYGAETDWWGEERVGTTPIKAWDEHVQEGVDLLDHCNILYKELLADQA